MRSTYLGAAFTAAILGAACHNSTLAPARSVVGGYRVATINGAAPPAVISKNEQRTISLVGATLRMTADNRFVLDDTISVAMGTQGTVPQTDHRTGTYAVAGTRITMVPDQPGLLDVTSLEWAGDSLTLTDPDGSVPVVIVLKKL